jgi:hypothetical protein
MRIITDPDEARVAFHPWRAKHQRPAWKPITEPGEGDIAASRFGGRPALRPGEPWPICNQSGKPQTLFLQLDLDALPEEAGDFGGGLLQFFFCLHCSDDGGDVDANPWGPFSRCHLLRTLPVDAANSISDAPPDASPSVERDWGWQSPLPARRIADWVGMADTPSSDEAEDLGVQRAMESDVEAGHYKHRRIVEWPEAGIS